MTPNEPSSSAPAEDESTSTFNQHSQQVHAQTNIAGDGNEILIEQKVDLFTTLYVELRDGIGAHASKLVIFVLLEATLVTLFLLYKDRYLWGWEQYILLAFLLLPAFVGWILAQRPRSLLRRSQRLGWYGLGCVASILWLTLIGQAVWLLVSPPKFADDQFGIAIATFQLGTTTRASRTGYDLAGRLYTQINTAIENSNILRNTVYVQRVGVIGDERYRAEAIGQRLNADLIIWGSLVQQGSVVDAHFKLLQGGMWLDNPAYPQTIPITERTIETTLSFPFHNTNALQAEMESTTLGLVQFSLGLAHFYNRKFPLAVDYLQDAIQQFETQDSQCAPTATRATNIGLIYYYLGTSYQIMGRYADSQQMYDIAECYNPDDLVVLLSKLYNYRVFDEEEKRQATFQRVLELSYKQPAWAATQAAYNRAVAYDVLEQREQALREFDLIVERDPSFFIGYLGKGRLLVATDRFAEARSVFTAAQALTDGDRLRKIWLLLEEAGLYKKQGDYDAAIDLATEALILDQNELVTMIYALLADLYAQKGMEDKAIANYRIHAKRSEVPNSAYSMFGEYLVKIGRYEEAITEFENALHFPAYNNSVLYTRLGLAYAALAQAALAQNQPAEELTAQALHRFELALHEPGKNEAWIRHEYGYILYRFGDANRAIKEFEQAINLDSGPAIKSRYNLGLLYEQQGERSKALAMYAFIVAHCADAEAEVLAKTLDRLEFLGGDVAQCADLPKG